MTDTCPDERRARKRAKAKAKAEAEAAKPKPKPRREPAVVATEANPYKRVADVQKEDDFMSGLLGDLASGSAGSTSKASSRVPSLTTSSSTSSVASMARKRKANGNDFESLMRSSTSSSFMSAKAGGALSSESDLGTKKLRLDTDPEPEHSFDDSMDVDWSPVVKLPDPEDELPGEDEEMSIKPLTANAGGAGAPKKRQLVNVANSRVKTEPTASTSAVKIESPVEVKPHKVKGMDWRAATELVNVQDANAADGPAAADAADEDDSANVPMTKRARAKIEAAGGGRVGLSKVNAFEKDSSLRFYWLDSHEADGVLHLLGKVLDKDSGRHISACLSIEGIERNVYLLPRGSKDKSKVDEAAKDDDDANSQYSADWESNDDDAPSQDDVYEEFDSIRQKYGIGRIAGKFVRRKYAFEAKGIPSEAEWFKVAYSFDGARCGVRVHADSRRPATARRPQGPHVQPCPRHQHVSVRALRAQAQDHGPLLARRQGCRADRQGRAWTRRARPALIGADDVVQVRGRRQGPQVGQPLPRVGRGCAQGDAASDGHEPVGPLDHEPQGQSARDCVRDGIGLARRCAGGA